MKPGPHRADEQPRHPAPEMMDSPPPFLGTWKRVYVTVLLYLVLLIALFSAFTLHFRVPS